MLSNTSEMQRTASILFDSQVERFKKNYYNRYTTNGKGVKEMTNTEFIETFRGLNIEQKEQVAKFIEDLSKENK